MKKSIFIFIDRQLIFQSQNSWDLILGDQDYFMPLI